MPRDNNPGAPPAVPMYCCEQVISQFHYPYLAAKSAGKDQFESPAYNPAFERDTNPGRQGFQRNLLCLQIRLIQYVWN